MKRDNTLTLYLTLVWSLIAIFFAYLFANLP